MSFEEMVVAIVASVGGIALVGYVFAKITGLISSWINRNKGGVPDEEFDRLARAFMEHKKDTQRRLKNLEAIIADEDEVSGGSQSNKQIEAPKKSIEIEDRETQKEESGSKDDNNLRNMLRE